MNKEKESNSQQERDNSAQMPASVGSSSADTFNLSDCWEENEYGNKVYPEEHVKTFIQKVKEVIRLKCVSPPFSIIEEIDKLVGGVE